MTTKNFTFKSILSLSLSYIIIYLTVYSCVFYNYKFYKNKFHTYKIYEKFSGIDIDKINQNVLSYIQNKESQILNYFFNQKEIEHLKDVKDVFSLLHKIFIFFIALSLILIVIHFFQRQNFNNFFKDILDSFILSSLITIFLIIILGLIIYFDFDNIFVKMHNVFFKPGTWLFEYTDNIINLYVEDFFFDIALYIVKRIIFVATLIGVSSYLIKKIL